MIYAVGTTRSHSCAGGLWMVDVSNPAKPISPGCVNQDGYVHDGNPLPALIVPCHTNSHSTMCNLQGARQEV